MPTTLKYGLPLVLLLCIALAYLQSRWRILPEVEAKENRVRAPFPEVRLDHLDPVPRRLETWYEDQWAWRPQFVWFSSWLAQWGVGRSPRPDKVVIGREGWLYKGGLSLDLVRGKLRFTQRELRLFAQKLSARSDSVAARGGRYYLAIAPLKGRIYPEHLPAHVRILNEENATDQLLAYLREHTEVTCIDLREPLYRTAHSAEAGDTLLYYRTDHHWTRAGALFAGQALLRRLAQDFPNLDTVRRSDYHFDIESWGGMSLAKQIIAEQRFLDQGVKLRYHRPVRSRRIARPDYAPPPTFPFPDDFVWDYRADQPGKPTIFVNRESFGNDLAPVLNEHFRRAFYYFDDWNHDFNGDVYAREGGDIYLQLVWEPMIGNLLGADRPAEYRWE